MPGLSIVVPAHNSGPRLRETLQQLVRELDRDDVEVIIVENGSSDDTWEIAEELAPGSWGFPVRIFRSEVGLGAAYLKGASEARGEVVLLTADDLPFGVTDIRSWESVGDPSALVIGSKAHPGSVVPRSKLRAVMSWGYRFLRRVILGMTGGGLPGNSLRQQDLAAAPHPPAPGARLLGEHRDCSSRAGGPEARGRGSRRPPGRSRTRRDPDQDRGCLGHGGRARQASPASSHAPCGPQGVLNGTGFSLCRTLLTESPGPGASRIETPPPKWGRRFMQLDLRRLRERSSGHWPGRTSRRGGPEWSWPHRWRGCGPRARRAVWWRR